MLDSFFNKGFRAAKCKTLLKLTIPRIKLLRNRREIQLKQMRKDIAKLLENGQESTARIRVEHIIREENMMAAQEIIELFCELIAVRLPIIEIQRDYSESLKRECPLDLKEAISTICFAAPRCSDLPELQQVQMSFAAKYGKEFIAAATELMPDCGVNRQIIELLSVRTPSVDTKLKLLKEIAEEHAVDWDPASTETEFLKPHEDLLNGPNHISTSPTLPLPEERHFASSSNNTEEEKKQEPKEEEKQEPNSDFDPYSWDLPEVPKGSLRANSDSPPSPAVRLHPPPPPPPFYSELEHEEMRNISSHTPASESENPTASLAPTEIKQFIPPAYEQFIPFAPPPSDSIHAKRTEAPPDATIDFQDVLAAAQAAAETAERAAAAARTAARLAQVRITELSAKKKDRGSHGSDNEMNEGENPIWNQRNPGDAKESAPSWDSGSPPPSSRGPPEMAAHSPDSTESFSDDRKPQRSTSIEDDPYFSYPNLFSRQDSSLLSRRPADDA